MTVRPTTAGRKDRGDARMAGTVLTALSCAILGFAYVHKGNGIAFSGGALFALALSLVALLCALLLSRCTGRWRRLFLGLVLAGCLCGAAIAAYFLEATTALIVLAAAIASWLLALRRSRSNTEVQP